MKFEARKRNPEFFPNVD